MKNNEERMYVRLRRAAFVPSEVSAFVSPILHCTKFFKKQRFFFTKACQALRPFFTTGFTTNTVFNTIWILPPPPTTAARRRACSLRRSRLARPGRCRSVAVSSDSESSSVLGPRSHRTSRRGFRLPHWSSLVVLLRPLPLPPPLHDLVGPPPGRAGVVPSEASHQRQSHPVMHSVHFASIYSRFSAW